MEWESYAGAFKEHAEAADFDQEYIDICLRYARRLFERKFPIVYDQEHFSLLVGFSPLYIKSAAYGGKQYYRKFSIPKKTGGERMISEPLPALKEIQRWILDNILYIPKPSIFAKGFIPERSIKDNARFHREQDSVLSLDIKDFFPSIKRHRVYGVFRWFGYSQALANLFSRLCTLENTLPQGAPTSPAISNIIGYSMDQRLAGFALGKKLRYTRYADDITISGNFDAGSVIAFVRDVVREEGFFLNEEKTRLMKPHQRQEVTGIVVNKHLQATRELRRDLRQAIHYIKRYGLNSHLITIGETRKNYLKHLLGQANFILYINPKDKDAINALKILNSFLKAE